MSNDKKTNPVVVIILLTVFACVMVIVINPGDPGGGSKEKYPQCAPTKMLYEEYSGIARQSEIMTCEQQAAKDPSYIPWYRKYQP